MFGFHRQVRADDVPPTANVDRPTPARDVIGVSVSAGLPLAPSELTELLGDRFSVQVDAPDQSSIAVIGAVGLPGVSFLKLRYPAASLLVVDDHWAVRSGGGDPSRAVGYLEAGADAYVAGRSTQEVAAHVRALARRLRPARDGLAANGAS